MQAQNYNQYQQNQVIQKSNQPLSHQQQHLVQPQNYQQSSDVRNNNMHQNNSNSAQARNYLTQSQSFATNTSSTNVESDPLSLSPVPKDEAVSNNQTENSKPGTPDSNENMPAPLKVAGFWLCPICRKMMSNQQRVYDHMKSVHQNAGTSDSDSSIDANISLVNNIFLTNI